MNFLNKLAIATKNSFLFRKSLLTTTTTTNESTAQKAESAGKKAAGTVVKFLNGVVPYILGIVAGLGVLWSIWIAIQMARADDAQKREEAKKKLLWVGIATVVLIVLFVFFEWAFPAIMSELGFDLSTADDQSLGTSSSTQQQSQTQSGS